jgi:hypothetical protein
MNQIIFSDLGGNLIYITHFGIATGDKSGFYTLRAYGTKRRFERTEFGTVESAGGAEDTSVYIKNLSTDKAQALEAAKAYLSEHYPSARFDGVVNFDLDEIARISREESERRAAAEAARVAATDFSFFQGGKYAGRAVKDILAEDKGYCEWFAGNWWRKDSDNERTAEIIKAILAPEREAEKQKEEALVNELRSEIGVSLESWEDGHCGSFCRSIAQELARGVMPSGRGLAIVLEILAKWAGRTGSKAFKARLAELQAKFA